MTIHALLSLLRTNHLMAERREHNPKILLFHKPYNVLTKFTDEENRPTLTDYIPNEGVYAAGRLDMDSEGLLLLTDWGKLSYRLTDPEYAHPRSYWVQVDGAPDEEALNKLRKGVELRDGLTRPVVAEIISPPNIADRPVPIRYRANIPTTWLKLTLTEGKNRQIRRMTAHVGHPTLRIIRYSIGVLTLDGLKAGEYRHADAREVQYLKDFMYRRS
jgi:23S rRNA pseudouridine2457 synthase